MSAGFTPGPWAPIRDCHFSVEQRDTGYTSWIGIGPPNGLTVVMAVTDGDCEDAEMEANARLIAEAPELLTVLDLLIDEINDGGPLTSTIEHAQDVIAKVRGEQ